MPKRATRRFSASNSSFHLQINDFSAILTKIARKAFVHRGYRRLRVLVILTTPSPNPHHILNWHHQQILQSYHEWQEGEEELND